MTWYNLGVAYNKSGHVDKAIECLKKSFELRPNYAKPRIKLGSMLALNDEFAEAATHFQSAIENEVRNIEGYQKLSAVRRRQQNWGEAIQLLNDALRIEPDNRKLLADIALGLLEIKNQQHRQPAKALQCAQILFALDKSNVTNALILALANIEAGRFKEALELINKFVAKGERKAEIGLVFAVAQKKLNSGESALVNFKGAKAALLQSKQDRVARVILEYAEQAFSANPAN